MQVTMSNWEAKEGLTNAQVSYGALDVLVRVTLSVRLTDHAPQQRSHVLAQRSLVLSRHEFVQRQSASLCQNLC